MISTFHIRYSWVLRPVPRVLAQRYLDGWPALYQALLLFLARYEGVFTLSFDRTELAFDLHPDLPLVFEDLPRRLAQLGASDDSSADLYFAAQGTDLALTLRRQGRVLNVGLEGGPGVGQRFGALTSRHFTVETRRFVLEWCAFLRALLAAMAAEHPIASEPSFQQYIAQLDTLAAAD